MDKFFRYLFSMSLMATALFAFFSAIAVATFIENDYGTPMAQKWIYKSAWFSAILAYLSLGLIANIFRYRMFQVKKIGLLTFHLALLVIIIGAAFTRFLGFEGAMQIREGESSNYIISSDTYVQIRVHDFDQQYSWDMPWVPDTNEYRINGKYQTDDEGNYFNHTFEFPGQAEPVSIEFAGLIKNIRDTLIPAEDGNPYLELVTVGQSGRQYNFLESGKILDNGGFKIAFNNDSATDAVRIMDSDSGIFMLSPYELGYFQMADSTSGVMVRDSLQRFPLRRLYSYNGFQFVFSRYLPAAKVDFVAGKGSPAGRDGVKVRVKQGGLEKEVVLRGGKGMFPMKEIFTLGDLNYELGYGSTITELPFSIFLRDFVLERYPGTDNPSSYSSYVTLVDHQTGKTFDHHIYMNNVLDYGGYRFFQSSYDPDEGGTILQVNRDMIGTNISYIGYLLLGLGFLINLFSRQSRFATLIRKTDELHQKRVGLKALLLLIGLGIMPAVNGQVTKVVDPVHAESFSRLLVQDHKGRLKPVHTVALELLRKVNRHSTYKGQSAVQVFIGIHTNPEWNLEPIIAIPGKEVAKLLNLPEGEKYACVQDFITPEMNYLLEKEVAAARLKPEKSRTELDKSLLKVDERFNIMLGLFTGYYFKMFPSLVPAEGDREGKWYSPFEPRSAL